MYHSVAQKPGPALENSWLSENDGNVGRPSGFEVGFADGQSRRGYDFSDRVNSRDPCCDLFWGHCCKIDDSWFVAPLHPLDSLFAVNVPFTHQLGPRFGLQMDCIRRRPRLAGWRAAVRIQSISQPDSTNGD